MGICAALLAGGAWYYSTQMGDSGGTAGIFGTRPEKRLSVVEQSNVDGRRKLVLIRRDNIEHLIMTGGPVDVVIETNIANDGINQHKAVSTQGEAASEPVFSRAPRSFGKAVGE